MSGIDSQISLILSQTEAALSSGFRTHDISREQAALLDESRFSRAIARRSKVKRRSVAFARRGDAFRATENGWG